MIQPPTEFETMRVLHSLFVKGLLTWDQVEELLVASAQIELTYLDKDRFESQSLDELIKYRIGG